MFEQLKTSLGEMMDALVEDPVDNEGRKGVFVEGAEEIAEDAGTHEGAVKAAQTRKAHGGGSYNSHEEFLHGSLPQVAANNGKVLPEEKVSAIEKYLQGAGVDPRSLRHGGYVNAQKTLGKEGSRKLQQELASNPDIDVSSVGGARGAFKVYGIPLNK